MVFGFEEFKIICVVCGFFYSIVWVEFDFLLLIMYELVMFFVFRDFLGVLFFFLDF